MLAIPLAVYAIGRAALEMHWLPDSILINLFVSLIRLYIIYIIARNGTVLSTSPYAQIIPLLISVLLIGSLFKILHWPYANVLLMAGYFGFAILYTVRFILKPTHKLLDAVKWLWACALSVSVVFKLLHWAYGDILLGLQEVLFWTLVFTVYYEFVLSPKKSPTDPV